MATTTTSTRRPTDAAVTAATKVVAKKASAPTKTPTGLVARAMGLVLDHPAAQGGVANSPPGLPKETTRVVVVAVGVEATYQADPPVVQVVQTSAAPTPTDGLVDLDRHVDEAVAGLEGPRLVAVANGPIQGHPAAFRPTDVATFTCRHARVEVLAGIEDDLVLVEIVPTVVAPRAVTPTGQTSSVPKGPLQPATNDRGRGPAYAGILGLPQDGAQVHAVPDPSRVVEMGLDVATALAAPVAEVVLGPAAGAVVRRRVDDATFAAATMGGQVAHLVAVLAAVEAHPKATKVHGPARPAPLVRAEVATTPLVQAANVAAEEVPEVPVPVVVLDVLGATPTMGLAHGHLAAAATVVPKAHAVGAKVPTRPMASPTAILVARPATPFAVPVLETKDGRPRGQAQKAKLPMAVAVDSPSQAMATDAVVLAASTTTARRPAVQTTTDVTD